MNPTTFLFCLAIFNGDPSCAPVRLDEMPKARPITITTLPPFRKFGEASDPTALQRTQDVLIVNPVRNVR